jgi:hypothetical protein
MKNLKEYISESFLVEGFDINDESSADFNDFLECIKKYSKSLKIQSAERQRYEKKGAPITKEIAQDLLSKRLYNNVNVRYSSDPDFFLDVCNKYNITVNMSNLGFGTAEVIKWGIPKKKINPRDIYFDDIDLVLVDKTIGHRWDDGGIEMLPGYEDIAEEVLAILKKKRIYQDDFYLVKK